MQRAVFEEISPPLVLPPQKKRPEINNLETVGRTGVEWCHLVGYGKVAYHLPTL